MGYSNFSTSNQSSDAIAILGGPFIRYYFSDSYVTPFFEAGAGIGKSWSGLDANLFSANARGGLAVFVNDNVAIDIGLGYTYFRSKVFIDADFIDVEPAHQGNINLSLGISVFVD
ncbi:hypothetical protein AB9P05_07195 [Roseivirga sp. BDSF3-8]|uniref:hypothetical protein n=1 Tax=Roseivirga sp. BDSF3-8 TaxID=3241598 RepID=UPI003531CC9C